MYVNKLILTIITIYIVILKKLSLRNLLRFFFYFISDICLFIGSKTRHALLKVTENSQSEDNIHANFAFNVHMGNRNTGQ